MRFPVSIHRKKQWDLGAVPLLCVHWRRAKSSVRVFCVWNFGVQIGRKYFDRERPFIPWRWRRSRSKPS